MRARVLVAVVLALGLAGCRHKQAPAAEPEPQPNRNPYRNVMPEKFKQKVEDTQKKEEQRDDKLLENAK
jgi:hypothetical protein